MKTWGGLFERVTSFENLLLAAGRARKGKRLKPNTAAFDLDLEANLLRLQRELRSRTWQPGRYVTFQIHEPKERLISAAPYRDRVVHHAVCNVIEPLFDASFIYDSYANRKGKGTHGAVDRLTAFCRGKRYALKCDIRKYFPSIDHDILYEQVARRLRDEGVRWLMRLIINSSNPQEPVHDYFPGDGLFTPQERRRGLPIGNLTSQFLANLYLNGFDHFIKEQMRCRWYVRYVDDFVVLDNDKVALHEVKAAAAEYLQSVRLRLHPGKSQIVPVAQGIDFLGYRVFPDHRRLRRKNAVRARGRLRVLQKEYANGIIDLEKVGRSVQSWIAHASHANTYGLRRSVLGECVFRRGPAPARVAGWFVEQQCEQPARRKPQQQSPGESEQQHRVPLREHF